MKRLLKSALSILIIFAFFLPCSGKSTAKSSQEKRIALTFDDGPHKKYTEEILDVLEKYQIKATFFVVGVCAEKYPEIVAREITSGHEIGNHTYSHAHLRNIKPSDLTGEIERAEQLILSSVNYKTTLFRPPEGVCNDTVRAVAKDMNYSLVLWSVDTRDWVPASCDDIVNAVIGNVDGDEIILMHDYVVGKSNTPAALEIIIPKLLDEGYTFVPVSELLQ